MLYYYDKIPITIMRLSLISSSSFSMTLALQELVPTPLLQQLLLLLPLVQVLQLLLQLALLQFVRVMVLQLLQFALQMKMKQEVH